MSDPTVRSRRQVSLRSYLRAERRVMDFRNKFPAPKLWEVCYSRRFWRVHDRLEERSAQVRKRLRKFGTSEPSKF